MAWTAQVVETVTGTRLGFVNVSSFSWARIVNSVGSGKTVFELGDPAVAEVVTAGLLDPITRTLVLEWDHKIVYAGIIWGHSYDRDTQRLTVSHSDLWSFWEKRLAVTDRSVTVVTSKLIVSGADLPTLALRIVQAGVAPSPDRTYTLPIQYQAAGAGGVVRTFYGYNVPTVAELLEDVIGTEGGPDIDFQPVWDGVTGKLVWLMWAGSLGANTWSWAVHAKGSGVSGLKVDTDAANVLNFALGLGEGQEKKMLTATAWDVGGTLPALDGVVSAKDISKGNELQATTNARIQAMRLPTTQTKFNIPVDGEPAVTDLRLGDTIRWAITGDPYLADGTRTHKLLRYSGSMSPFVNLEFQ